MQSSPSPLRPSALLIGFFGLVAAIVASLNPEVLPEGLSPLGMRTLGCTWIMAVWWIGSGLSLAIPALIPLALFPVLGIADSSTVAAPYAHKMVLLLLCGFLLAQAVERWDLHKRMALQVLVRIGRSGWAVTAGVMAVTAVLSMWISNTATVLMMLPIVQALALAARMQNPGSPDNDAFGKSLLLGLAYAASIGGTVTPVGTPPNLLFQATYAESFPGAPELGFAAWMEMALPAASALLLIAWFALNRGLVKVPATYRVGHANLLKDQLNALGPWTAAQRRVGIGFAITCALWVLRVPLTQKAGEEPLLGLPWGFSPGVHDSTIAAFMVIVFFLLPSGSSQPEAPRQILDWRVAKQVPWDLLLLFGGGIALSVGFKTSGLTSWLADQLTILTTLPVPLMIACLCLFVTFLTEVTSNTATTALLLPVLAATATATGIDPLLLMVPATLAASCAFMLPVATAPNAIVLGSGDLDAQEMLRTGLVLNVIGVVPITLAVLWWVS